MSMSTRGTFWTLGCLWCVFGIAALVICLIGSIEFGRHNIQATCTIGGTASGGCVRCGKSPSSYTCQITWRAGSRSGVINDGLIGMFNNLCRFIPDRYGAIEKCWVASKGKKTAINQKNRTDCVILMSV